MAKFKKYQSIENSYREKYINNWIRKFPQLLTEDYIITEKIHGANFSIYITKEGCEFAKKTNFIKEGESFFNYYQVMNQENCSNLIKSFQEFASINNLEGITLYGELFGKGIQPFNFDKVITDTGKDFRIFDIEINGNLLSPKEAIKILEFLDLKHMYVPIKDIKNGLYKALDFDIKFNSIFSKDDCEHPAEGVVIRPYNKNIRYYDEGLDRETIFIIKNKNENFSDKSKQKVKVIKEKSKEFNMLYGIYSSYITNARVESAFSKHGIIQNPEEIGKFIKIIIEDCKEEFFKDYKEDFMLLDEKEQKYLFSYSGKIIVGFLQKYL